jgi:integrase
VVAAIRQTVISVNHDVLSGTPKTKAGARRVDTDTDTDLVFSKVNGDARDPDHFSREFVRRVARWGYPKLSLHGLRHTWATPALMARVHPKVVQERLGRPTRHRPSPI